MNSLSRITGVLLAVVMLCVLTIPVAPTAEAQSTHDAEVLRLINEHRANLGRQALVEWPALSQASMDHSEWMAGGTGAGCGNGQGGGSRENVHDLQFFSKTWSLPAGATTGSENVFFQCASVAFFMNYDMARSVDRLTYAGLPDVCKQGYGSISPLRMFCGWINSDSHRPAIENPQYTHIGLGTVERTVAGAPLQWSTNRFTNGPVAPSTDTCNGRAVTVDIGKGEKPTQGSDVIMGTPGADVIYALGGNDWICPGTGDDVVFAGPGNDYVDGSGGKDKLFGGSGNDTLLGGWGNDKLHGNFGNDELRGQGGDDKIFGYGDDDRIYGGDGNDTLHGNYGDDRMWGGPGNDKMWGYGDDDVLYGEAGDDLIVGNFGDDLLYGGDGADLMKGAAGDDRVFGEGGNDTLQGNYNVDYLDGGSGNDSLDGGVHTDECVGGSGTDSATRCQSITSVP